MNAGSVRGILAAVEAVSGTTSNARQSTARERTWAIDKNWAFAGLGAAFLATAAYLAWSQLGPASNIPTVAVAAADRSNAAAALARDLLVKLGSLQAARTDSMRLIQQGETGAKADLTLEVAGPGQGSDRASTLALFDGNDRSLLWSKDFSAPAGKQADLRQQLAYTASGVLDCALEGMAPGQRRLGQQTLKLYLSGCSAFADASSGDVLEFMTLFREVVRKAPEFEGGWAHLLLAERSIVATPDFIEENESVRQALRNHIEVARKLNPRLAEADLADAELMPQGAIFKRMQLVERAVRNDPDNAAAISTYSLYVQRVGRMRDSITLAQRAGQLAPLSPAMKDNLIGALTYAGRFDEALEELRKADLLWPGASNIANARYRLHLRYGDPREALRMQATMGDAVEPGVREAFLRARIDPSASNIDKAIGLVRPFFRRYPEAIAEFAQVLGAFGKDEELFSILLNWQHPAHVDYVTDVLFRPALKNFRSDPRMMAVAKRLWLLDYWQSSGRWPDFCFEPNLPYDCKKEAAKLAA